MIQPTPDLLTLCVWRGRAGPPLCFGRTPEDAERRTLSALLEFYTRDAEEQIEHPRVRARQELHRYKDMGLTCIMAPSEEAAFTLWLEVSSLSPSEALRRFREVIPAAAEPDPITAQLHTLSGAPSRPLPRPTQDRLAVLGRIADKLPRMSAPGVDELRQDFSETTR